MKSAPLPVLLLTGALLLWVQPAPGQQPADQPFRGANIVRVHTTAPPDSVLAQLARHLRRQGFTLDTVDAARGVLTTAVGLPAASRAGEMKIRAVKAGADWKLIGTYVVPAYGNGVAYPAVFNGAEMMPAKSAFRLVESVARAVPQGTLRYDQAKVKFSAFTKLDEALKVVW